MIKEAIFSLKGYKFSHVMMNMDAISGNTLNLDIKPKGRFVREKGEFVLNFLFSADSGTDESSRVIEVNCEALYSFKEIKDVGEIPSYFYSNSIAILFPYVRAFVSTLSLQACYNPVILPTMNLSTLADELKRNVTIE
mgnify:CR=1 FL=1